MSTDVDTLPRELPAEEEPRYLRRQKPLEVRRRKFGRRGWPVYRRALATAAAVIGLGSLGYAVAVFFLFSPRVRLADTEQIELTGNRYVSRQAVVEHFEHDLNVSIFCIPLDARRAQLETIPWVSSAVVSRLWPNRLRVEISERSPLAYLRNGAELALIDAQGVILDRPPDAEFQFPVVSGLSDAVPVADRAERMAMYSSLMREMEQVRAGASDQLSEVDLSDADDVRAVLVGMSQLVSGLTDQGPLVVHFGSSEFGAKFRLLIDNLLQWRATAGRVESVDLRFSKQVVVNPESGLAASNAAAGHR
jgi:cell division protein FtsQ